MRDVQPTSGRSLHANVVASQANWEQRRTLLVVEDQDFVREVACEVLLESGYRVLRARNAAEALHLFEHESEGVQLLLTDVVLPGRSGHGLAKDLRGVNPGLTIIFTSGYPDEIARHGLEGAGMFYLPKPFSADSLRKKVAEALEASEVARRADG